MFISRSFDVPVVRTHESFRNGGDDPDGRFRSARIESRSRIATRLLLILGDPLPSPFLATAAWC